MVGIFLGDVPSSEPCCEVPRLCNQHLVPRSFFSSLKKETEKEKQFPLHLVLIINFARMTCSMITWTIQSTE